MDNITSRFYDAWKRKYIKYDSCTNSLYVYHDDPDAENICVSEGQGYGMVIVAYMAGYDNMQKIFTTACFVIILNTSLIILQTTA